MFNFGTVGDPDGEDPGPVAIREDAELKIWINAIVVGRRINDDVADDDLDILDRSPRLGRLGFNGQRRRPGTRIYNPGRIEVQVDVPR